ncbi:MAG: Glycosyl transferase family 2, partial [Candidatus Daviesbacteria bacterium GW2011_GWA1_38_7]
VKIVIAVPAFNESQVIFKVLKSLPRRLKGVSNVDVVVIDDGSLDQTLKEAQRADVNIVRHLLNRGLGAAIKTGFSWAKKQNADIVVTFDADGQHDPRDISKLIQPIILKKADVVIGSRFLNKQVIPSDRFLLNWFANFATFILYGVLSTDSQSGLRAFSKKTIDLIDFKADRMDFSSEILLEAKRHNLKVIEVPIKAIYTDYSRIKGQKNINAIPVFARFLVKLLR